MVFVIDIEGMRSTKSSPIPLKSRDGRVSSFSDPIIVESLLAMVDMFYAT